MPNVIKINKEVLKKSHALLDKAHDWAERRRALLVILMADKRYSAKELATRFHMPLKSVYDDIAKLSGPAERSPDKQSWGGRRNCLMTHEEEEAFLSKLSIKYPDGLDVATIHEALTAFVGKKIAKSTTYRMLDRHGWR
jgi:transposase